MDLSEFEAAWAELKVWAAPEMAKQVERWIKRRDVPRKDGVRLLDQLRHLRLEARRRQEQALPRVRPLTREEMDHILGVQAASGGLFFCHSCRSNEFTRYDSKQMRAGDEGPTTCVTCTRCHKSWRL